MQPDDEVAAARKEEAKERDRLAKSNWTDIATDVGKTFLRLARLGPYVLVLDALNAWAKAREADSMWFRFRRPNRASLGFRQGIHV